MKAAIWMTVVGFVSSVGCWSGNSAITVADINFDEPMIVEAAEMELPGEPTPEAIDALEAAEEIIGEGVDEGEGAFETSPEGYVSFDFQDADIRLVLRMFSKKFGVNIVPSPQVQGLVSIRLSNVHWEKALKTILSMHKFVMQRDEDIIKVLSMEEVDLEPTEVRIYTLGYTNVEESQGIIEKLLTLRGHVDIDKAGNKLIITDVPTQLEKVEKVINELDKQTQQVLIEVRILEKEANKGENVGIKWDFMKEYKVGFTDISREYTKSEFMVTDSVERSGITQAFTSAPGQVERNKGLRNVIYSSEDSKVVKRLGEDATTPEATFRHMLKQATLSPADFDITLSALLDRTDVEILSQPRITTVDNKPALIKVVEQRPIPKYTFNPDTGRWEISGFEFKDIGIVLDVTPHINKDSYITLDIVPVVSKSDKTLVFSSGGGGSAEVPIIELRTTNTRVIVLSGETLVIGGLITSDSTEVVNKIPLLGDLPLISPLFKHKSTIKKTKDLMIFITPTIISESMGYVVPDVDVEEEEGEETEETPEEEVSSGEEIAQASTALPEINVEMPVIDENSGGIIYSKRAE